MPEEEAAAFSVEANLDSIDPDDEYTVYNPTAKTPSHFLHAHQVISELKTIAKYPLVGPCKLDLRQRWGHQINLTKNVWLSLLNY